MGTNHTCHQCENRCTSLTPVKIPETMEEYNEIVPQLWANLKTGPELIINLTNECPLRCRYCFVNFAPHNIILENLDLFLTRFLEGFYGFLPIEKTMVTFFGGEPLMRFKDIIVPIVTKFKDKFKWSITTNGVLLTEEIISFMVENNFSGGILSIDGAPETQNFNRPFKNEEDGKSSEAIEKMIPSFLKQYPSTTFRSTLIPETVEKLNENLAYAMSQGFTSFFCCPDEFSDWFCENNKDKIKEATQVIAAYYISCFTQGIFPMKVSLLDRILTHLVKNHGAPNIFRDYQSPTRCGLGIGGWGINVDGTILGCQEKSSQGENIFVIGNIWEGIDKEKHLNLLKTYSQSLQEFDRKECQTCIARTFCLENVCPSRQIDIGGKFNPAFERANCVFKQETYQTALELDLLCLLSEDLKPIYFDYLNQLIGIYDKEEDNVSNCNGGNVYSN